VGNFQVTGNQAIGNGGSSHSLATINQAPVSDTTVQADINLPLTGTHYAGVVARASGTGQGNCYLGQVVRSGGVLTASLYKSKNGVWSPLSSAKVPTGSGTLRLDVVGTSLKLFLNDSLATYAFDNAPLPAGAAGIRAGPGDTLDNFSADIITPTPVSLPFTDGFTGTDGSQLSRSWTERQGNFSVKGNQLQANDTSLSVAMVTHDAVLDMTVQVSINLSQTGVQYGGVIGRASGQGLANYYLGKIVAVNGVYTAYLYAKNGSKWTLLSQKRVSSGSGVLTLTLAGSHLQLFFNGLNVGDVTNTLVSQAGLAGLLGSKGMFCYDFSVMAP
jgi:hypothetical protein